MGSDIWDKLATLCLEPVSICSDPWRAIYVTSKAANPSPLSSLCLRSLLHHSDKLNDLSYAWSALPVSVQLLLRF
jgi:hypothetical protein